MSDGDLASLRVNAVLMADRGSSSQAVAAGDLLCLIDAELGRRAALPRPPRPPRKPAPKKPPPVSGHQTALPTASAQKE